MTVTDKIYNYFDKNPDLRVLFIFNDEFLAMELAEATWKEGYRYVDFKGDWFTTKYNLDTTAMWISKGIGLRQNTIWIPHGQTKRLFSISIRNHRCNESHYKGNSRCLTY